MNLLLRASCALKGHPGTRRVGSGLDQTTGERFSPKYLECSCGRRIRWIYTSKVEAEEGLVVGVGPAPSGSEPVTVIGSPYRYRFSSLACLEDTPPRCEWGCTPGPFFRCRKRLARELREFAAMEDQTPRRFVTPRSSMIAAAAELEAIGRSAGIAG